MYSNWAGSASDWDKNSLLGIFFLLSFKFLAYFDGKAIQRDTVDIAIKKLSLSALTLHKKWG